MPRIQSANDARATTTAGGAMQNRPGTRPTPPGATQFGHSTQGPSCAGAAGTRSWPGSPQIIPNTGAAARAGTLSLRESALSALRAGETTLPS